MQRIFELTKARVLKSLAPGGSWAIAPFMCVVAIALSPISVSANTPEENQTGANRVASVLAEEFRGLDIKVQYQAGNVWLYGDMNSQAEIDRAIRLVSRIEKVQTVHNGLKLNSDAQEMDLNYPQSFENRPVSNNHIAPAPQPTRSVSPVSSVQPNVQANMQPRQPINQVSGNGSNPPQPPVRQAIPTSETMHQSRVVPLNSSTNNRTVTNQRPMPVGYNNNGEYPVNAGAGREIVIEVDGRPVGQHAAIPGNYHHPNVPNYAWPSYAAYPNYAQVTYPKQYTRRAWPYIGPFYPYPKAPPEWRKVTMEYRDGWWWLDFDDGSSNGPFSPFFRDHRRAY